MIKASVVALSVILLGAGVSATLDPATGSAIGKKPTDSWIATASAKESPDIQDAECSHNTRMANQKFAWFKIDPSKVNQKGSTYGTCYASATAPSANQLETNSGYESFFWQNSGGQSGTGTGPIKDPNTGQPGYEDNSGKFHLGDAPGGSGGGSSTSGSTSGTSGSTSGTSGSTSGTSGSTSGTSGSTSGTSGSTSGAFGSSDGTSGSTGSSHSTGTSDSTGTFGSGKGKHGSGASGTGKSSSGADLGVGTGGKGGDKHSSDGTNSLGTGATHSGVDGNSPTGLGNTRNKITLV